MNVLIKVGPKGQVLIPKLFRKALGIQPGFNLVVEERGNEIVFRKPSKDFLKVFEEIAFSGKSVKVRPHEAYEEELESRLG